MNELFKSAMNERDKQNQEQAVNLYTGRCTHRGFPKRRGKYAVSWEEYNKTGYPSFCAGPAYVLSRDLVPRLVNLFNVKHPLPLEDVYIGTLINKIGGVKAIWHPGFRTLEYGPCRYYSDIFAYHRVKSKMCMNELFKSAMKERDKQNQEQAVFLR